MQIIDLNTLFGEHPQIKAISARFMSKGDKHVLVSGLHASARSMVLKKIGAPLFVILDNAESAQYMYSDLRSLTACAERPGTEPDDCKTASAVGPASPVGQEVFFFPAAQKRRAVDEAAMIQRTETLSALNEAHPNNVLRTGGLIIVTYPEAIIESVPAKEELSAISFQLSVGQEIQISAVSHQLSELGFEHVDFVFQPGQYAVRGSIVDIYSYSHDNPYRLDFFGDEIDSIREFDIEDQLSKNKVEKAEIVGAKSQESGVKSYILDYLSEETVWVSNDWSIVQFKIEDLRLKIEDRKTIEIAEKSTFATHSKIAFETIPQPVFHKQFDILTDDLKRHIEDGYKVYILAEQQKQLDRLEAIFESLVESTKTKDRPLDSKTLFTLSEAVFLL